MKAGLCETDHAVRSEGYRLLCGVDEVGRGPLAGPVVAGAVILNPLEIPEGLDDSKKLPRAARRTLEEKILKSAVAFAIGVAEPEEIDEINILRASLLAMKRAVSLLGTPPDFLFVDGIYKIDLGLPQRTLVGGDGLSASIAAASIIAKEHRDRLMAEKYAAEFPQYGFEKHMGYPTAEHREALAKYGPSAIHRKTFKGVREFCQGLQPRQIGLL